MFKFTAAASAIALLMTSQPAFAVAKVAVGHFAPFAATADGTAVNVLVNGEVAIPDFKFKDFTDGYIDFEPGEITVDIVPVGATEPALSATLTLVDETWYTVYAQGDVTNQPLELVVLEDNVDAPEAGSLNLRVVHAAPFAMDLAATEVSIRTAGGAVVNELVGVPYKGNSGFFPVPAANYDLKVSSNDGYTNYIDPAAIDLPEGLDITVFAVGDGVNQPLAIIAFPVGELPLQMPIDNRYNGMWGIQEGTGTGFVAQPMAFSNRLVGTWYTYDDMGSPTFLTFDSCQNSTVDDDGLFVCGTPGAFAGNVATTGLYLSTGGGPGEDAMVVTEQVGTLTVEFMGCFDAKATVDLEGQDPEMYTAVNLTRPFPCVEAEAEAQ